MSNARSEQYANEKVVQLVSIKYEFGVYINCAIYLYYLCSFRFTQSPNFHFPPTRKLISCVIEAACLYSRTLQSKGLKLLIVSQTEEEE